LNVKDKFIELQARANIDSPHIIMVTETHFHNQSSVIIDGYSIYRRDRGTPCGGVAIYIQDGLEHGEPVDKEISKLGHGKDTTEQVWCYVKTEKDSILIGCVYRPPTSNAVTNLRIQESLKKAKRVVDTGKYTGMLVAGDFNLPKIKWLCDGSAELIGPENSLAGYFLQEIQENNISQHVTIPTFKQANGTCVNTLDLVFTDTPERIPSVTSSDSLGSAHMAHLMLNWEYLLASQSKKKS